MTAGQRGHGGPGALRRRGAGPRRAVGVGAGVAALAMAAVSVGPSFAGAAPTPQDCGFHGSSPVQCWTVDSFDDGHDRAPGDGRCATTAGTCTLRAAMEEAVAGTQYSIDLAAGTYRLTLGHLEVPKANGRFLYLVVSGEGAGRTRISGEDRSRVFDVGEGSNLWLRSLTVERGRNNPSTVFPGHAHGAGIHNHGNTFLTDVTVAANAAVLPGHNSGGGIANASTGLLTMDNSTVVHNLADGIGGAIENGGELQAKGSTIAFNMGAGGGALAGGGAKVSLDHTLLAYNYVKGPGTVAFGNCAAPLSLAGHVTSYAFSTDATCGLAARGSGSRDGVSVVLETSHADERVVPAAASAVVDAGAASCRLTTDLDGNGRPADGDGDGVARCDVGAIERQPPAGSPVFTLVDADTDLDVRVIRPGAVLVRSMLPPKLNIRADFPTTSGIASVVFELDGTVTKTENVAPYALGGDAVGDYVPTTIANGAHTLIARAFSAVDGGGTLLRQGTISFSVRD